MYSNVTPPALPEWDTSAYPYYVLVFVYEKGQTDWYGVRLVYSAVAFTWNGSAVTNAGTAGNMIYSAKDGAWGEDTLAGSVPEIKPGLGAGVYQRIYTSHDIKDSAGNIRLAAGSITEAVETVTEVWLRSFQTGLALGLAGKPLPIVKKEPVAYLYNGVRLPKLPEWDKEMYPYAWFFEFLSEGNYVLHAQSKPATQYVNDSGGKSIRIYAPWMYWGNHEEEDGEVKWYQMTPPNDDGSKDKGFPTDAAWTNHDIYDEEGNLVFAASEPIPVYE